MDDRQKALYDEPFDAMRDATMTVTEKILLKREDLVGTLVTTSGNFGSTTAGGAWSGAGTPGANIATALAAIVGRTGVSPANIWLVVSFKVWQDLLRHADTKNLFLNTTGGAAGLGQLGLWGATPQAVANAYGLGGIAVGSAVKLTSLEGAADVFAPVYGNTTAALIVRSPLPNITNPGWGAILAPTIPGMPKGTNVAVDIYREEQKKSDIVRATAMFDTLAVTPALGQLITGLS